MDYIIYLAIPAFELAGLNSLSNSDSLLQYMYW